MISLRFVRYFAIVLTAALALGCAESPTGPSAPSVPVTSSPIAAPTESRELLGLVGGVLNFLTSTVKAVVDPNGIPVSPVKWASTHTNQERSVSGTIGYWGGTLAIPGSDFTITFPVGALQSATSITIVSDASGYVSYDMQPHGLTFAKPVVVVQRLRNTEANSVPAGSKLFGAYFRDEDLLSGIVQGLLNAVEIVTSITVYSPDGQAEVQTWLLNHFSRYMLASG
ncbi:MAG: hypothetical protein M3365_08670 [Gemmatimonadota bacterium]|nr:hypothetical protein [Gemmatimonadota bacterium]